MNIKTVAEVKEKIKWYGKRWTEINALYNVWVYMQYGFKYDEEHEKSMLIEKMYRSAKMFFLPRVRVNKIAETFFLGL